VTVEDPFGVAADPVLTTLARSVDPAAVQALLDAGVEGLAAPGAAELTAIRVIRHKPQRRCLVEYDVTIAEPDGARTRLTAIGKVRRNRPGRHQLRLQQAFRAAGFDGRAGDGIAVPQPLGEIPELSMWLQRRVEGVPATDLLLEPGAEPLAVRLVDAAHKIHSAGVPTHKTHDIADEMRILRDCLLAVTVADPGHAEEVEAILTGCSRLAGRLPVTPPTGIHRDYYSDQVLVDGERLNVVDFDLYTRGDAALDVGNLLGHVTEHALRHTGDADALAGVEAAALEHVGRLAGPGERTATQTYAVLSLARHVFLASERPGRDHLVAAVIDATRTRLARAV